MLYKELEIFIRTEENTNVRDQQNSSPGRTGDICQPVIVRVVLSYEGCSRTVALQRIYQRRQSRVLANVYVPCIRPILIVWRILTAQEETLHGMVVGPMSLIEKIWWLVKGPVRVGGLLWQKTMSLAKRKPCGVGILESGLRFHASTKLWIRRTVQFCKAQSIYCWAGSDLQIYIHLT